MSQQEPGSGPEAPRTPLGADFLIPAFAVGLTAYYFVSTTELVWEAKATGIVIGLVLLALCVAVVAKLGLRIGSGRGSLSLDGLFTRDAFDRQRLGLILMLAVYIVTIHWVGATVGLFFLLIGAMRLMGVTSWRMLIAIALVSSVFVHLTLITLLDGRLPRGWLLERISATIAGA
jgi:hypothetical protein